MPYSVPEVWVEAADPGMCDFPVRRESGAGNRISGDFFVSFFGRAKKEMPRRHEASGATGAPRHERTKKEQTPVGDRHIIKLTVKWPGHALRPSGRAGRSLPQRRPATPIAPAIGASPAGCDPMEETVRIKTSFRVSGRAGRLPTGGPQFVALCAENCDRSRASDPNEKIPVRFSFRFSHQRADRSLPRRDPPQGTRTGP